MKFYGVEQLGPRQELTPEGFLICYDVPVARTGKQIYGPGDGNPIAPGPDGLVHVERTEAEVFRPQTMASANGKDVVDDHPIDDVMPHNYRELTCGVMLDPRRGTGDLHDCLVVDLLIKEASTIKKILDKTKLELSLGYDAEYVKVGPGEGQQINIVINHCALVERGRCGSRCSIGDRMTVDPTKTTDSIPDKPACGCKSKETEEMATKTLKQRVLDALRISGKVKDEAEMEKMADGIAEAVKGAGKDEEGNGGDIHLHLGPAGEKVEDKEFCTKDAFDAHVAANAADHAKIRDEMNAMMAKKDPEKDEGTDEEKEGMAEEAPAGSTKDAVIKARDSAYLEDSFGDTLAGAEILVPGIRPPMTFDRARNPVITYRDGICAFRRTALDMFYQQPQGRAFIDEQLRGRAFNVRDKSMSCSRVADMFRGAVAMKKAINNGQVGDVTIVGRHDEPSSGSSEVISVGTLAEQAAAAWKN